MKESKEEKKKERKKQRKKKRKKQRKKQKNEERKRKLQQQNFIFWVNSVCAQPGSRRKEFDFLICEEGVWLRVEIDGDSHNEELAHERDQSEKWLEENFVITKRFRSCSTDGQEWAEAAVEETFQYIEN